ncbi:MAG: mechanosensitive ion channel [Bacteroidales bacterium]|nr:mechanosensitive ion channel [Bacteroidales bacterium]
MFPLQTIANEEAISVADSAKVALQAFATELAKDPSTVLTKLGDSAIQFGLKVVAALAIYIIGAWIIKKIKNVLTKVFEKRKTESTLASFVISLVSISLTVLLVITTISTLGINTTSLAALLAAGGMAIGMALSGTVQNFAGGIMILIFKPFKAGDFINVQGIWGTVTDVTITSTKITTADNRVVVIPNGTMSSGTIDNYSTMEYRRVDWTFGFEYGVDAKACIDALLELLKEDERVLDSKTEGCWDPFVVLINLGASSVDFSVKAWVKNWDYRPVQYDYNLKVYTEMPKRGFNFPFPQMDVHVKQN